MYTTIKQVRRAFWLSRDPLWYGFKGWDCREYPDDIQQSFTLFVGLSRRLGDIPESLTDITL